MTNKFWNLEFLRNRASVVEHVLSLRKAGYSLSTIQHEVRLSNRQVVHDIIKGNLPQSVSPSKEKQND